MKQKKWLVFVILSGAALPASTADTIVFTDLLGDTSHALGILEAEADVDSTSNEVDRDRGVKGWKFTAAGGYGHYTDIIDTGVTYSYNATRAQLGLTYPLLGAWDKQARQVDVSEGKLAESHIRLNAAQQLAQLELEANYARYWGAQEELKVANAYLASEPIIEPRLKLRAQNRLMLESEHLALASGYEHARGDRVRLQHLQDETRNRLQQLTGRQLGPFDARAVMLPKIPEIQADTLIKQHPDLAVLNAQRDALKEQLADSNWYGIEGGFDIAGVDTKDLSTNGKNGNSVFVGLNITAPLSFTVGYHERKRLKAEIEKSRLKYQRRSDEIVGQLQSAVDKNAQLLHEADFSAQHTQAASRGLTEGFLRSKTMENQGIDTVARRLNDYYSVAIEQIEARIKFWQANIELRSYLTASDLAAAPAATSDDLGGQLSKPILDVTRQLQGNKVSSAEPAAPLLMPASYKTTQPAHLIRTSMKPADAGPARNFAVYVWNSQDMLAQLQHTEKFWSGLQHLAISRLLLSLNAQQIEQAKGQPGSLETFIEAAQQHGVAVELLLGEPSWIEPQHRDELITLIKSLRAIPFAGLHLDIEPHQLYKKEPLTKTQFDNWIGTLRAAAAASPWPTAVDVHPRYFRDAPYTGWNLAQQLRDAGVKEVVLMIYNSNPRRVADVAKPIIASGSGMRFSVAQSIEQELSPGESHARQSPEEFQKSMQQLQTLLAGEPNTGRIALQGWNDLMRMGYESEIR